jgi:hypothetical protein
MLTQGRVRDSCYSIVWTLRQRHSCDRRRLARRSPSRREAGGDQLGDAHEQGVLGIARQVLEMVARIVGAHLFVERVSDDGVEADMVGAPSCRLCITGNLALIGSDFDAAGALERHETGRGRRRGCCAGYWLPMGARSDNEALDDAGGDAAHAIGLAAVVAEGGVEVGLEVLVARRASVGADEPAPGCSLIVPNSNTSDPRATVNFRT